MYNTSLATTTGARLGFDVHTNLRGFVAIRAVQCYHRNEPPRAGISLRAVSRQGRASRQTCRVDGVFRDTSTRKNVDNSKYMLLNRETLADIAKARWFVCFSSR